MSRARPPPSPTTAAFAAAAPASRLRSRVSRPRRASCREPSSRTFRIGNVVRVGWAFSGSPFAAPNGKGGAATRRLPESADFRGFRRRLLLAHRLAATDDVPLLRASRDDELGAALAAEISLSSFSSHLKDLDIALIRLLYPRGGKAVNWRRGASWARRTRARPSAWDAARAVLGNGGSERESNPPRQPLGCRRTVLKTARATRPYPLPCDFARAPKGARRGFRLSPLPRAF